MADYWYSAYSSNIRQVQLMEGQGKDCQGNLTSLPFLILGMVSPSFLPVPWQDHTGKNTPSWVEPQQPVVVETDADRVQHLIG